MKQNGNSTFVLRTIRYRVTRGLRRFIKKQYISEYMIRVDYATSIYVMKELEHDKVT